MEDKTKVSCFAYSDKNGHEGCRALTKLYCKEEDCKFYKPKHKVDFAQIEKDIKDYATYKK